MKLASRKINAEVSAHGLSTFERSFCLILKL